MKMHKHAYFIALIFFIVPFFWLKPGFVDLGGDGRIFFLNPFAVVKNSLFVGLPYNVYLFANIPYSFFLYLVKLVVQSPTLLIAFENGIRLSFGFLGIYYIVTELLVIAEKRYLSFKVALVGIVSGIVYVCFTSKTGWSVALVTQNQVFLNVVIFYLLLKYCLTKKYIYFLGIFITSILFSLNFGFSSSPQVFSFFPLSFLFIFLFIRFVAKKNIPGKGLFFGLLGFLCLHAFHFLPVIAVMLTKNSVISQQVFSENAIHNQGINYFKVNHVQLGKMSLELFQPWLGQNVLIFIVPIISILGFLIRKTRLHLLLGSFFALTLFLVTANITQAGVAFYQLLFHIPGFAMFRSFDEKWYFVYVFYFILLFAVSFYLILEKRRSFFAVLFSVGIITLTLFRSLPFLSGKSMHAVINPSHNVSTVYTLDPDLLDTLNFIQSLPSDGKVLTAPLTFTYFQVSYGKDGNGAYNGISLISNVVGRQDFAGWWHFGGYKDDILKALKNKNISKLTELFSLLNIRYIFYNSDRRIMDNLPRFFDPQYDYPDSEIPQLVKNQDSYELLFSLLPVREIYKKGFYTLYEFNDSAVRPLVHIPEYVASQKESVPIGLYNFSFVDSSICKQLSCDTNDTDVPFVTYKRENPGFFTIEIDVKEREAPFLLVFSNPFDSRWSLTLPTIPKQIIREHIVANGYSNGWIIDPSKLDGTRILHGRIYLEYQNYFYLGSLFSILAGVGILLFTAIQLIRRKHEKK